MEGKGRLWQTFETFEEEEPAQESETFLLKMYKAASLPYTLG